MSEFESLERDIRLSKHDMFDVNRQIERHPGSSNVAIDLDLYRAMARVVEQSEGLLTNYHELQKNHEEMRAAFSDTVPASRRTVGLELPTHPIQ